MTALRVLLQVFAMMFQLLIAILNLSQHLIEPINEEANFVIAELLSTNREILFRRDDLRRLGQFYNRCGNEFLELRREQESK